MPVSAYVTRDETREWPYTYAHEATGAVSLLQRLYTAFSDEPHEYAVIANLHSPQADLVVISELGFGVVELKHHPGRLSVSGATWATEHGPIKAGADGRFANPREQVQHYAGILRERLVPTCASWWSLMEHNLRKNLRTQTAVCFTHPGLVVAPEVKAAIMQAANGDYGRHGGFDLLKPHDFPAWAAALRFEVVEPRERDFRPYRLEQGQIAELVSMFGGVEWTTAKALMPSDQAYAYLLIHQGQREPQIFALHMLELQIGRSASNCGLIVPRGHGQVSRVHAQISRHGDQIWLQDRKSSHGTFVNGVRVSQAMDLSPGDRVTLGGPEPGPGIYSFAFMRRLPSDVEATETFKEPR